MNIKVAIADDHQLIAEGVGHMLRYSNDIELIASYSNGLQLLEGLKKITPDVLLLDINMPDKQGGELADIIKAKYTSIKIIVLTSFDSIFHIKNIRQHEIDGYLLKSVTSEVLQDAIKCVYNGGHYLDATVEKLLKEDAIITERQKVMGTLLTKREKEILQLIANNHTSAAIADMLFLSKRTIEHHRESILSKLDVKKSAELIMKARTLGLISG